MLEVFEQPIKMMQKTTAFWRDMAAGAPWMKKPEASVLDFWNHWLTGVRSANELNMNAWKVLVENTEDAFFKMFKESQAYSESMEQQLRENWGILKQAQKAQQKAAEDFLVSIQNLLKKQEEA
jgi:hypothetical protein